MIWTRFGFLFVIPTALQLPSQAESGGAFLYQWNGHGFHAAGGGGGFEALVWKRVTVGADVSALRDTHYTAVGTFGHVGGLTCWFGRHIGARVELRVGARPNGDNIDPVFRAGIALR